MSDSIHRVTRPTGTWQIVRCELRYASRPPWLSLAGILAGATAKLSSDGGRSGLPKIPAAHAAAASRPAADERA